MKAQNITIQKLATRIERLFEKERDMASSHGLGDPLSDTKVIMNYDHILITYDGGGNDMLSLGCRHPLRSTIEFLVKAHGLYVEDNNNWSASIWF